MTKITPLPNTRRTESLALACFQAGVNASPLLPWTIVKRELAHLHQQTLDIKLFAKFCN